MVADSAPSGGAKGDNECKIFVGALSWDFTDQDLIDYFSTFGSVMNVTIKTDINTGNPRGFGFVVFDSKDAVDKVVSERDHKIQGKKIDPKRITEKEKIKKIFVGGVSPDMTDDEVKTHFEQFGAVEEVVFPSKDGVKKGFCFVTFADGDACDAATAGANAKQQLGSKQVDVKKAVPQDKMGGGGGRGGRGGGRGGAVGYGGGYGGAYGGGYGGGYGGDYSAGYDPYAAYGAYSTAYPGYGGADPYGGYGAYGSPSGSSFGGAGGKMRGGRGGGRGAGRGGRGGRGGPY